MPSFSLKRKREAPQHAIVSTRCRPKWEPPRSTQEWNKDRGVEEHKRIRAEHSAPPTEHHTKTTPLHKVGKALAVDVDPNAHKQISQSKVCHGSGTNTPEHRPSTVIFRSIKNKRAACGPETSQLNASSGEPQTVSKVSSLTLSLTSDPRIKYSGKLSEDEKTHTLAKAIQSEALVLTLVYSDGSTQLDPKQKLSPSVCGFLLLMKNDLEKSTPEESLGPNDSLVYCKLEHTPAWAQQCTHSRQELFTRDMLLQVLSRPQLVVCYKAKELLRVALPLYRMDLTWKQGCHIQDPQVSGWLLDPADPASCFQDLLNKHCRKPRPTPAVGTKKVSYSSQSFMFTVLYFILAMESHQIHVDKEALKRTSDLLGAKMKQLEQEAHRAAGQIFLLTSSSQLRTVLFEKLRLHERCENKKLPKTVNKQQSTSEAAVRHTQTITQTHECKDRVQLSLLNYISSTWFQTSAVTGRITSKHPVSIDILPSIDILTVHPRSMFISQDGWTFLAADFCQVELRLLAHLTSDPELLRIFTVPEADVFAMLASQWKGIGENEVTSEDREHAKRIVYSVVYGAGPDRLSGILGVSVEQARRFQDSFLQTYKEVPVFIQRTIHQCHVLTIMGRRRTLPNINSPDWAVRMQAERQAVNFVVQGSAADLCKMAMIRIFNLLCSSRSLSARFKH
uniref:Polymerase (DNA directed) nu n=1 Tax=Sphaeramia orbicularis TaxID=375764 RepID=A0A672YL87_9TELE